MVVNLFRMLPPAVALGVVLAGIAPATAVGASAECSVLSSSGSVAIVVCPSELDQAGWRDAGIKACAEKVDCNAWFWIDRAAAPKTIPLKDADIPRDSVGAARAVWSNSEKKLMLIRKVDKK